MPGLADTTVRLLGQEPLAGRLPTAEQLRIAEILDGAGYAYLEVSGGGCFESAVRRGVESPWERIRALRDRVQTPLGLALRGRFLVGSRPVDDDFIRRFIASAAANGIDVFRLHDPLNDVSNLREAAERRRQGGARVRGGAGLQPGPNGRDGSPDGAGERAAEPRRLARSSCTTRPARCSRIAPRELVDGLCARRRPADRHLLPGLGRQRTRCGARGGARRRRADRVRGLSDRADACIVSPARRSRRRSQAWGSSATSTCRSSGRPRTSSTSTSATSRSRRSRRASPSARLSTTCRRASSPALKSNLRAQAAGDRLDEVLEELDRIRAEVGWPPLASPIGQMLGSQALLNVLSASRYSVGRRRAARAGRRATRHAAGADRHDVERAVALTADPESPEDTAARRAAARSARRPKGSRPAKRSCCCSASSAKRPSRCCARFAARSAGEESTRRRRRRPGAGGAHPRARAHRPGDRHRRGHDRGGRACASPFAARRTASRCRYRTRRLPSKRPSRRRASPSTNGLIRIEAPMVGTFYRAPQPGSPPFVEEGRADRCRPDALHPRGDEADERGEGRHRRHRAHDSRRERTARRVRPAALRARARHRATTGRVSNRCSRASSLRTAARLRFASFARCTSSDIEAVAVYSTADAGALHTRLADRAVCIGPPSAGESYLKIPSVVAAGETTGCDAVHPGYGFLAENPEFVRACEDNDLVFIGPDADVMARMGDKVEAKRELADAGVPLVPGTEAVGAGGGKQCSRRDGLPRPAQGLGGGRRQRHAGCRLAG